MADPGIGVGDIQSVFRSFMEKRGSRDLKMLLASMDGVHGGDTPTKILVALENTEDLVDMLVKLVPNCVLNRTKVEKALVQEDNYVDEKTSERKR